MQYSAHLLVVLAVLVIEQRKPGCVAAAAGYRDALVLCDTATPHRRLHEEAQVQYSARLLVVVLVVCVQGH